MSSWVEVPGTRYALTLDSGRLVCRGSRGKVLATLPRQARDSDTARALFELRTWMEAHARDCLDQAERWMLRALPVPGAVLAAVWPDPAWRAALGGAVVAPVESRGWVEEGCAGLLMDVDGAGRVGVLSLGGARGRLDCAQITLLHPALIAERGAFASLAEREGVVQGLDQLSRTLVERPQGLGEGPARLGDYRGLRFEDQAHARAVCREVGCSVKGALMATCTLRERAQLIEARLWLGRAQGAPVTGELLWVDQEGHTVPLGAVGRVAWSEGHRMARRLWSACGETWGESDVREP